MRSVNHGNILTFIILADLIRYPAGSRKGVFLFYSKRTKRIDMNDFQTLILLWNIFFDKLFDGDAIDIGETRLRQ